MHAADDPGGVVQPLAEALLGLLQHLRVFLEPIVHVAEHLAQLLLDLPRPVIQRLADLNAQLVDLLLHHQQRPVLAFFPKQRLEAQQKNPTEQNEAGQKQEKERQRR